MHKVWVKLMFTLMIIFVLQGTLLMHGWALTYTDDCASTTVDGVKQYQSLTTASLAGNSLPDTTALSPSGSSGYAVYRVSGAERVTVGLYTPSGSFVQEYNSMLVQGTLDGSAASTQALYSVSEDAVYARYGGEYYKMHMKNSVMRVMLRPGDVGYTGSGSIPGDLVGYGANVYVSANGNSWSRISLSYVRQTICNSYHFYEELTGSIPSGSTYIKVEVNSVQSIPNVGGGSVVVARKNSLASVAISGVSLVTGESQIQTDTNANTGLDIQINANANIAVTEPIVIEPVMPEFQINAQAAESSAASKVSADTSKASSSTSSKASGSAKSSKETASGGTAVYDAATGKFEGVIVDDAEDVGAAGIASQTGQTADGQQALAATSTVYTIGQQSKSGSLFNIGIGVYIVVVTGALIFMVLLPYFRK